MGRPLRSFLGQDCDIGLVFAFFYIPENASRTIAELDILFERRILACKFAEADVTLQRLFTRVKARSMVWNCTTRTENVEC
jgi:hypothetical protein